MTLDYLRLTGRAESHVRLVVHLRAEQGCIAIALSPDAAHDETMTLDLSLVEPCSCRPETPQDRVSLRNAKADFQRALGTMLAIDKKGTGAGPVVASLASGGGGTAVAEAPPVANETLAHGDVVVAAITSCTNTSNPSVMVAAGLLAKKAVESGLQRQPWVKTSLAPGSKVVTDYLQAAGLMRYLDALGFNLVGYGCTTCIGNSGPLPEAVAAAVAERKLVVCSVLSGNRNFEGRIQSQVRANYLASPPLVVAYAIAGRMTIDMFSEPLGKGHDGRDVFLRDIWPTDRELQETMLQAVTSEMFARQYANVFDGDEQWPVDGWPTGDPVLWDPASTPTFVSRHSSRMSRGFPAALRHCRRACWRCWATA